MEDIKDKEQEKTAEENIQAEESVNDEKQNDAQNEAAADNNGSENNTEAEENAADSNEETKDEAKGDDTIEDLKAEIEILKDKYLRCAAEFDNFKKRTLKEKTELILNGSVTAVKAILPVLDDIERAIANGQKTDDAEVLREGMQLISKKFETTLTSLGVKKIDTTDADFNTDYHEAVAMVPGLGKEKSGKVIDCVETGYMLNDKVIRHAKVAVGAEC